MSDGNIRKIVVVVVAAAAAAVVVAAVFVVVVIIGFGCRERRKTPYSLV